jgi:hypothetical protein
MFETENFVGYTDRNIMFPTTIERKERTMVGEYACS